MLYVKKMYKPIIQKKKKILWTTKLTEIKSKYSISTLKWKLPSVKYTWAALYMARFGLAKSCINECTDFSLGVIRYTASIVDNGSLFLWMSSTTEIGIKK